MIKENGALVKGETVNLPLAGKEGANMESYAPMIAMLGVGGVLMLKALMFLGFVGLSMIIISFWMKNVGVISSVVEKQWLRVFLWGILGYILIAPVALILAITIIGIPLIMIEALAISVAVVMGYVSVSQLIGKKFLQAIKRGGQPMMNEVLWGLVILFLIDLIPVLGGIVKCIVITLGFGSAIVTKLGTQR